MRLRGLGELEQAIMEVVWSAGRPVTGRQVVDALNRTRPVAYTTVLTVMDRLVGKRLLAKRATGKAHRYRAAIAREAYVARLMHEVLGAAANPAAALLHFVEQLPPGEADRFRAALTTGPGPRRGRAATPADPDQPASA